MVGVFVLSLTLSERTTSIITFDHKPCWEIMRHLDRPSARRGFLGLWCMAWLGVCALLLSPVGVPSIARLDLLAHAVLFGAMAFMTVTFCRRPVHLALFTLVTLIAGGVLEGAQSFVSYRSFDPLDAIANAVGAAFGFAAALSLLVFVIRPATAAASPDEAQTDATFFSIGPSGAPPKM